jgi:hypothetical protein
VVNFALTESGDESVSDSRIDSRKIDFWEKFFSNGARMGREIEINLAFFPCSDARSDGRVRSGINDFVNQIRNGSSSLDARLFSNTTHNNRDDERLTVRWTQNGERHVTEINQLTEPQREALHTHFAERMRAGWTRDGSDVEPDRIPATPAPR